MQKFQYSADRLGATRLKTEAGPGHCSLGDQSSPSCPRGPLGECVGGQECPQLKGVALSQQRCQGSGEGERGVWEASLLGFGMGANDAGGGPGGRDAVFQFPTLVEGSACAQGRQTNFRISASQK